MDHLIFKVCIFILFFKSWYRHRLTHSVLIFSGLRAKSSTLQNLGQQEVPPNLRIGSNKLLILASIFEKYFE